MSGLENFITELVNLVWQLVVSTWNVVQFLGGTALQWALPIAWFAWWLLGVKWSRAWPVLRGGGWVGVVLAVITGAMVWAQLAPSDGTLGIISVPNFWWQLAAVSLYACATLICGWLQGVMGWEPVDIELEPPETAHHGHGDAHGHH